MVFLYLEENSTVAQSAEFAKNEILKQQYSEHLLNVTWENVVSFLVKAISSDDEMEYLFEFKRKYLNYSKF